MKHFNIFLPVKLSTESVATEQEKNVNLGEHEASDGSTSMWSLTADFRALDAMPEI